MQTTAAAPALDQLMDTTTESPVPAMAAPAGPRLVVERSQAVASAAAAAAAAAGVQAPLFPLQEVPRTMSSKPSKAPMSPAPSMRRKAARAAQPSLFDSTHEGSRTLPTSVEAAVCCDASVGNASDRIYATFVDTIIPLAGFAMFVGAFYGITGGLPLDSKSMLWFGGALGALILLYRVLWCAAGFDTPGMQAAHLRLLTFDGRYPTRTARLGRIFGGVISTLPLGLGLAWALAEEERLTWHDYISSTFPARRF